MNVGELGKSGVPSTGPIDDTPDTQSGPTGATPAAATACGEGVYPGVDGAVRSRLNRVAHRQPESVVGVVVYWMGSSGE